MKIWKYFIYLQRKSSKSMAYSKINIVIKKPSQSLERRIREIGRRKYERLQQMRKDWESGVSEESKPTLAK